VVRFVESLFVMERLTTLTPPSTIRPDPTWMRSFNAMLWPVFVSAAPSFTVRVPAAVTVEEIEIVPLIVRLLNLWPTASAIVVDAPVKVTVEVPAVNEEPTPEESQLPLTAQAPLVNVIVPEVPPVIATFVTFMAEAFAARSPPLPITKEPPVRARSLVASVVVPAPP
jgi:hypothetical protein